LVTALEVTRQTLHIPVYLQDVKITERALIDSGAGANLISKELAANLKLPLVELRRLITVGNVDGSKNINGTINYRTIAPVTIAGRQHIVSFLVAGIGDQDIILGLPWLVRENPKIDWKAGTLQWEPEQIEFDEETLTVRLLESFEEDEQLLDLEDEIFIRKVKISERFEQLYGGIKKEITSTSELVPKEYHDYLKLFDKTESNRFPSPRPYDHEIHLKPTFQPR
jgi:Retroviral aspartyl protease